MLVAIVGGRLQGVELACLAKRAGWQTLLVDRDTQAPARGMADRFVPVDVTRAFALDDVLRSVDLVIPALENQAALDSLVQWDSQGGVPVAFDSRAYAVSNSKIASNRLFAALGIPTPAPWPVCGFPVVAKPDRASGSHGVRVLKNESDARDAFPHGFPDHDWVFQRYLDGPSFSLEVIGRPGNYAPLQVTRLFMDAEHDCKAVAAPSGLSNRQIRELETLAVDLAEALRLTGLMDVEAILHEGQFKVLEIDARFPSQTPLAVYHSTGCNMLEMLVDSFLSAEPPQWVPAPPVRCAILAHIRVTCRAIVVEGEHIMAQAGPLKRVPGFFGADEAITSYHEGARQWAATLIVTGGTREDADLRCKQVLTTIRDRFDIETIVDRGPEGQA